MKWLAPASPQINQGGAAALTSYFIVHTSYFESRRRHFPDAGYF
jgi:hypothetical protein